MELQVKITNLEEAKQKVKRLAEITEEAKTLLDELASTEFEIKQDKIATGTLSANKVNVVNSNH